ncbi:TfoX/Sxy family protein [Myxococcota bacterium]|nr:TfoX/Sxy family protein [Myxococcota bacterium]
MPYDPQLADRVRALLAGTPGLSERKMFGGVGWMIGGNMAVGVMSDGGLMVRCSPEQAADLVQEDGCTTMVHGGRPMRGWLRVTDTAVVDGAALDRWVRVGRDFARALPPKE